MTKRLQIFEEGDECIIIADIPFPKMCKLQPEKNACLEVTPSDEHCLINCFAAHLKKILDIALNKLDTDFRINFGKYKFRIRKASFLTAQL